MDALSTLVDGDEHTLELAADLCDEIARKFHSAADLIDRARNQADDSWGGASEILFDEKTADGPKAMRNTADGAQDAARAYRDMASALRNLKNRAQLTMDMAKRGGLETRESLILAPDRPTPPDKCERFITPKANASKEAQEHKQQVAAYNAGVDVYNQKRLTFNACIQDMREMRIKEQQAHEEFRQALSASGYAVDTENASGSYPFTYIARANTVLATAEGYRSTAERWHNRLNAYEKIWDKYARGEFNAPHMRPLLEKYEGWMKQHGWKVENYQKINRTLGPLRHVGKAAGMYPFKGDIESLAEHSKVKISGVPSRLLKGINGVGTTVTVVEHGYKALTGKEDWSTALLESGGQIGGGILGSAVAGAAGGAITGGPAGVVVGGIIGGIAGSTAGSDIVMDYKNSDDYQIDTMKHWRPLPKMGHMEPNE